MRRRSVIGWLIGILLSPSAFCRKNATVKCGGFELEPMEFTGKRWIITTPKYGIKRVFGSPEARLWHADVRKAIAEAEPPDLRTIVESIKCNVDHSSAG